MFFDLYILELLRFETLMFRTITFSDATLSDINIVFCYFLSQYPINICSWNSWERIGSRGYKLAEKAHSFSILKLFVSRPESQREYW